MKKILISFIGNNDCFLSDGKEGSIVSILRQREFDVAYLLYNDTRYLEYASQILLYCKKRFPRLTVRYQEAESLNPIDYNVVYPTMVAAVQQIQKEEGKAEYTISLTSGTPTMHSCWLLIVMGGIIPAKLIQSSREEGIHEVNLSLDDFPKIVSEKQAKIELTKTHRENVILKAQLLNKYSELIGEHESISEVKRQIDNLAKYDIPVYVWGESGTGKEVVARLLHYNGKLKEKTFVAVNCGSISENLFESEFFGHKKGSFTGAIADHEGYFKQADGGTLFMDEVGDLPLPMQVKLLRAIETGSIQPIGGKAITVNVRLITASNKDLAHMVTEKLFREDLYYRIVQAQISLSPLRDRGYDVLLLAKYFLHEFSRQNGAAKLFSKAAEKKLLNYSYPGNVRQLQNIVKLAYINSYSEVIEESDLHFSSPINEKNCIEIPPEGIDLDNEIIPAYYKAALKMAKGNASEAARLLKLQPHTFRARVRSLEGKD